MTVDSEQTGKTPRILQIGTENYQRGPGSVILERDFESCYAESVASIRGIISSGDDLGEIDLVLCRTEDFPEVARELREIASNGFSVLPPILALGNSIEISTADGAAHAASNFLSTDKTDPNDIIGAMEALLRSDYARLRQVSLRQQKQIDELQQKLAQQEKNLYSFIDTASNVLLFVDPQGRIIICNKAVENLVGVRRPELIGQPIEELFRVAREMFESPESFDDLINRLRLEPDELLDDSQGHKEFISRAIKTRGDDPRYIGVFSMRILSDNVDSGARLWGMSDITDLKHADEQLRTVVDAAPIPLILTRLSDGKIIYGNQHICEMMGVTSEELIGRTSLDFYFDRADRRQVVNDLEQTGKSYREIRLKSPSGEAVWCIFSLVTTEIAGEKVIIGGLYDITQRREMEEELRQERNFISAVLRTAGALVVVLDPGGRIVQFNRACEEVSGYSAQEVVGRCVWDFLLPEEAIEPVKKVFADIKASTFSGTVENHWVTRSGEKRLIEWQNTELLEQDGKIEAIIATGIDITEKRKAEDALRMAHAELEERVKRRTEQLAESEALNRAMVEAIPDMIFRFDREGRYLEIKAPEGSPIAGDAGRMIGHKPSDFLDDDTARYLMQELKEARESGAIRVVEYAVDYEGTRHHMESRLIPYGNDEVMAIVRDVTDRVEAQQALQDAHDELEERVETRTRELAGVNKALREEIGERRLAQEELSSRLRYEAALANCSQVLMSQTDFKVTAAEVLRNLRNASGATTASIFENFEDPKLGLCCRIVRFEFADCSITDEEKDSLSDVIPYKGTFARWRELLSNGEAVRASLSELPEIERQFFEPHGVKAILVIPIFVKNEWYGFIGFEDGRSERVWKEDDVRALRTASEMLGVAIARKRAEDALRLSEERFRNIVENANDIIFLLNREGDLSYVSPNWSAQLGHSIAEVIGQSLLDFVHPSDLTECRDCLREMLQTLERQHGLEYRVRHKDGQWRWHTISISPMTTAEGELISYVCVSHDVTEQKRTLDELAEAYKNLKQTQGQLIQSEKMASLGMLVAGIAHEINTPTGAVVSMHNTLMRALKKLRDQLDSFCKDPQQQEQLNSTMALIDDANKVIVSGTDRVTNIVRRLRSFARLDEAESKTVDIHEGLEDTLTLIYHEIKHDIEIIRDFNPLPPIACYPGRLNQVFLNLLINAKQAIQGKGKITIRTRSHGNKVTIAISDTGVGIAESDLDKIFDPGFTTKGVGVGTGLGLSICYQIIQDHRGSIAVESEVGKGTTFTVSIPIRPEFGEVIDTHKAS